MRFALLFCSAFVAALAVACSSSTATIGAGGDGGSGGGSGSGDDGGGGGGGSGTNIADGCAKQAAAFCAFSKKCSPLAYGIDFADDTQCETVIAKSCVYYTSVPDSTRSGDDAAACAAVFSAKTCTDNTQCASVPGKRPTGSACQYGGSCASGYCAIAGTGTCGICADYVALGASCSTTSPCDYTKGNYCGQSGKCIPYGKTNDACGTGLAVCGPGLICVQGKCGTGAALGDACPNGVPCDITTTGTCDSKTMKCTAATFLSAGAACGGATLSPYCAGGLCLPNASGMGNSCVADLPEGATCDPMAKTTARCLAYLTCNDSGKCGFPDDLGCK
jgi:hypothetical protein